MLLFRIPGGSVVMNPPVMQEATCNAGDAGSIPESGRSLGKEMTPHSNILAWKIPQTYESSGL